VIRAASAAEGIWLYLNLAFAFTFAEIELVLDGRNLFSGSDTLVSSYAV
jgi:hypothetical protein